jgi:hypothetical protein
MYFPSATQTSPDGLQRLINLWLLIVGSCGVRMLGQATRPRRRLFGKIKTSVKILMVDPIGNLRIPMAEPLTEFVATPVAAFGRHGQRLLRLRLEGAIFRW